MEKIKIKNDLADIVYLLKELSSKDRFDNDKLYNFAQQSNKIENIFDEKKHNEHYSALSKFVRLEQIKVSDIVDFVLILEPHAHLRTLKTHCVYIGGRECVCGTKVQNRLEKLLEDINDKESNFGLPAKHHLEYELIHPFMDCNGRSGRAVWLWEMISHNNYDMKYDFLRCFYYQINSNNQYKGGR